MGGSVGGGVGPRLRGGFGGVWRGWRYGVWMPAFAGMTGGRAGMTGGRAGMTGGGAGRLVVLGAAWAPAFAGDSGGGAGDSGGGAVRGLVAVRGLDSRFAGMTGGRAGIPMGSGFRRNEGLEGLCFLNGVRISGRICIDMRPYLSSGCWMLESDAQAAGRVDGTQGAFRGAYRWRTYSEFGLACGASGCHSVKG